jgi:hypothetical protein
MGVVMIKCPQTGREIPTGIKADRQSFRCSAVFFARTYCAVCQADHEWFAKEAWVYEPCSWPFDSDIRKRARRSAMRMSERPPR